MTTRRWLDDFLAGRGQKAPDERLLCGYECTDEEYRSLIDVLARVGIPNHLRRKYSYGVLVEEQAPSVEEDERLTMPAFVLYGSEWFHREWGKETRGVWPRIMNEVGWSADEYWELYPAMAWGLAWWNHSFIRIIKTEYLGTFAYQSGRIRVTGLQS